MARVDSIQKPTTLLTLKKSKEIATDTANDLLGEIMLITDDDGTVQGDIRITSGKYYDTMPFVQVGSIIFYAGDQIPDGYLACDGSYVSQRLYPELFNKTKNFWWNKPFQEENFTQWLEVYYLGAGNSMNSTQKTYLEDNYKIHIVENVDHPEGWEKNLKGQIFQERVEGEYFYLNKTYLEWGSSNPQTDNTVINGTQVRFFDFNNTNVKIPGTSGSVDPTQEIVREPVFVLPKFTEIFTASEHFRDELSGYFIRNLNESQSATNPDYYKTEYDDRGLWRYQRDWHNSGWRWTTNGHPEWHLTRRAFSSLQENEIKRHRHRVKDNTDQVTNVKFSGVSGAHAHRYHGSQNSTNGDPLGTAAISQGQYDRFGRGYNEKSTYKSGYHNHFGYVGYGADVTDESHQTFVKNDPTNTNSYETRPWSHSVQFCIKY